MVGEGDKNMEKRKALGKGLQALIPEAETKQQGEAIAYINVGEILPNRYQPREDFNEEKLTKVLCSLSSII